MMQSHSMSTVRTVERLWQDHPAYEVADMTGVPKSTIWHWSREGLIEKSHDHRKGSPRYHDDKMVERADALYDKMPLKKVATVLDVPHTTLRSWRNKGWIQSEVNWRAQTNGSTKKGDPARAVYLVVEEGMTQRAAAEKMGISQATISRYLQQYRMSEYEKRTS